MKYKFSRNEKRNVQIITAIIVPMLLIAVGNLGYAALTDKITTVADLQLVNYDIEIIDCRILYYNGYKSDPLTWTEDNVFFFDNLLFSGWELTILTTIHNKAEEISWICVLNYTIYYWNTTTNDWTLTDETELQNLFGITYTGEFYLDEECTDPMPPDYELPPCNSVYHREHLTFNGLETPEIENLNFTLRVSVCATYPSINESGGK